MFGVCLLTSTILAREPSTPSMNNATARKKKAKGKFWSITASNAKKLKTTPETVKRWTEYERKTLSKVI